MERLRDFGGTTKVFYNVINSTFPLVKLENTLNNSSKII